MSLASANTITKIVVMTMIGLGVLALTLMDVRGVMHGGPGVQDAATVNGERITTRDVEKGAEDIARQMNIPRDKIDQSGVKQYVLQNLIIERLTTEALQDMGLRFSDKAVAAELRAMLTDPKNPNGDLAQRYEMLLRQTGQNRAAFENSVRTQIAKRVVNEAVSATLLPDPLMANAKKAFAQERRDVAIITITPNASAVKGEPSQELLESLYEANKAAYTIPEKRSGRVYRIPPETLKKVAGESGDPTGALVEIEDAFFGGDSPDVVAKQYDLSVAETLKDKTKPDGDYGATLFVLEPGETSSAISLKGKYKNDFGFVILDSLTPAAAKPLADVRGEIVAQWKKDEARDKADSLAAVIKASDDPIAEAKKAGASVETRSNVAPSDALTPLFETAVLDQATELPTTDKDVVKLGVVTKITHGDSQWHPAESSMKDFQTAQAQKLDELFMQMMAPYVAKAKVSVNQKALAPAPTTAE